MDFKKLAEEFGRTEREIERIYALCPRNGYEPQSPPATESELREYLEFAQMYGLDPLLKQVHFLRRWNGQKKAHVPQFMTGIDGLRMIADRTGEYAGGREPLYEYDADGKFVGAVAYVTRVRLGHVIETGARVAVEEFMQTKKSGEPTETWAKMPKHMTAKCAEALALRRAFPDQLSGLYTQEEMGTEKEEVDTETGEIHKKKPVTQRRPAGAPEVVVQIDEDNERIVFEHAVNELRSVKKEVENAGLKVPGELNGTRQVVMDHLEFIGLDGIQSLIDKMKKALADGQPDH